MTLFQPTPLPLSPSLNRMLLADLPVVTEGFSGTQGNAWLTTWAIAWLMDAEPGLVARLRESGVDLPALPSRTEVRPELMTAATRWPSALDLLLRAGPAAPGMTPPPPSRAGSGPLLETASSRWSPGRCASGRSVRTGLPSLVSLGRGAANHAGRRHDSR
ncbi:hypothetical protein [Nostocoides australiense]